MNKIIAVGSLSIALVAGAGTALAANVGGETIPVPQNNPIVSLASPGVAGEAYPNFAGPQAPVISEQSSQRVAGEPYPTFSAPRPASRYAQEQIGRVAG